jgi:protocatechuate 3,4-dioxygenase beta subunit
MLALGLAWPAARILARAQDLGTYATAGPPVCTSTRELTPATRADGYRPNAPDRTMLRDLGVRGTALRFSGYVVGLRCGAIRNAQVEYWQADADGRYDTGGYRLRGQQRTNADGRFLFDTIEPGPSPGHAARCIHLRVTPPNHTPLTTTAFFPDDPARTKDPEFKPALVATAIAVPTGKAATFDVVFDL